MAEWIIPKKYELRIYKGNQYRVQERGNDKRRLERMAKLKNKINGKYHPEFKYKVVEV